MEDERIRTRVLGRRYRVLDAGCEVHDVCNMEHGIWRMVHCAGFFQVSGSNPFGLGLTVHPQVQGFSLEQKRLR